LTAVALLAFTEAFNVVGLLQDY